MTTMSNTNTNTKPASSSAIPCYRCGAPVAHGVEGLRKALETGAASATAAYYVHGTSEAPTCGDVIVPGASSDRAVYGPFRKAVAGAMAAALTGEGYVRIMHVPMPVKAGGAEEAAARVESERLNALRNAKNKGNTATALAEGCLFAFVDGAWGLKSAMAAAPPPPPAPPGKDGGFVVTPPPPPAMYDVAMAADGSVRKMARAQAVAALKEGSAYAVFVNGAWADSL